MVVSLKETVEKAQRGDLDAFGRLIERFQDAVYGTALALLGNLHDAQDVAQEAFVQAWYDLKNLRDLGKFPAWLCRIARNRSLDLLRRRENALVSLEQVTDPALASSGRGPAQQVERTELRETVLNAIRSLSEPLRLATTLYYINGYSVEEVGELLEVPRGTVKRRLHSARKRLKERMVAMVEDELKGARPGPEFRERVLRNVSRVEVRPEKSSDEAGLVMLVDDTGRWMPIIIGKTEELAIDRALKDISLPRPLTHELFVSSLAAFGVVIEEVRVIDLRENTFYGQLVLKRGKETHEIDCRPSDGIALAMLTGAKVTVAEHVIAQAVTWNDDGKPLDPAEVWRRFGTVPEEEAQKLADRAVKTCGGLADLSDERFKILVSKVNATEILAALSFGWATAIARSLRDRVRARLHKSGELPNPVKVVRTTPEVAALHQDRIKALLEEFRDETSDTDG